MLRYAIAAFALAAPVISATAEQVRTCASDIIAETARSIMETVAPGSEPEVRNSADALQRIRSGEADLAIVAIPDGTELPGDLHCVPFANEVAILVVNDSNPLKETSLDVLANALSTTGNNKWSVFGLGGIRAEKNFVLHLPDTASSMTQQVLRSHTIRAGSFKENTVILSANDDPETFVREQVDCLMVLRGLKVPPSGHALMIANDSSENAFAHPATESSVFYGDYPLRLPFYIVTRKDAPRAVADLEENLLSDAAADELTKAGYVPVPKNERDSN